MKSLINRRHILKGTMGAITAANLPRLAFGQTQARIVIVGGGFGGASAARTLAQVLPSADLTLIEANALYTACPFSNLVIGGDRAMSEQTFSFAGVEAAGIRRVLDRAIDVDADAQSVRLESGQTLTYDRLILSPGIQLRWNAIEGYDQATAERLPHAWKAGAQTQLLRDQLQSLDDGATVLMTVPSAPYRCPPGPYERASMIAHYLKRYKPKSKLIVLDAKSQFSKMDLFQEAWAEHYPDQLEWRGPENDGTVIRVDAETKSVFSDFSEERGDVVNVIPPQKAAEIAVRAGVTDATGWCPIDPLSFQSSLQSNIHVIGDATIAAPMPKSAFSASLQGKVCAIAVARILNGMAPEPSVLANTCYSFTTPDEAISIAGVYTNADSRLQSVSGAGGVSPAFAEKSVRNAEAAQAAHWFRTITHEAYG